MKRFCSDIFPTVIDMVTALVHSTQIAEPGDRIEEMKRQNMNLIKKLKKVRFQIEIEMGMSI